MQSNPHAVEVSVFGLLMKRKILSSTLIAHLFFLLLTLLCGWVLLFTPNRFSRQLRVDFFLAHPHASYEEKMVARWGDHYLFVQFINSVCSTDAKVLLPSPDKYPGPCYVYLISNFFFPQDVFGEHKFFNASDITHVGIIRGWWPQELGEAPLSVTEESATYGVYDLKNKRFLKYRMVE